VDHRATRKKVIAGLVLGGICGWGSVIPIEATGTLADGLAS